MLRGWDERSGGSTIDIYKAMMELTLEIYFARYVLVG
jgi:hypothetical protein